MRSDYTFIVLSQHNTTRQLSPSFAPPRAVAPRKTPGSRPDRARRPNSRLVPLRLGCGKRGLQRLPFAPQLAHHGGKCLWVHAALQQTEGAPTGRARRSQVCLGLPQFLAWPSDATRWELQHRREG